MSCDILCSLDLAEQFNGIAADAFRRDFHHLDDALGIDNECAAVGQADARTHHIEVVGHNARRITDHRIADLANGRRRVVPSFVAEMRVGRHGVDFNAQLFKFSIMKKLHFGNLFRTDLVKIIVPEIFIKIPLEIKLFSKKFIMI